MAYASLVYYGSVTSPALGGTVTAGTVTQHGNYSVSVLTGIEGTNGPPDNNNMQLLMNGGTIGVLMATGGGTGRFGNGPFAVAIPNPGTVQVVTVGTSTTASVYSAQVSLTPISVYPT